MLQFFILQNIRRQLANENVSELDMIRMVSLYALRYEKHSSNDVGGLLNMLTRRGVSEQYKKVPRYNLYNVVVLFSLLSLPLHPEGATADFGKSQW